MATADKLRAEGFEIGYARGLKLGFAEGRVRLLAEVLLEQLTVKFGAEDDEAQLRMLTQVSDQLQIWGQRVLTASTVDEVIGVVPSGASDASD